MKNILLTITVLFSSITFSQIVRPNVYVFGNRVQVQTFNNTQDDIRCSGFVYARTNRGLTETHYHSAVIYKGMSSFRNYYSRNYQTRYSFAYHNIFCSKF